MEEEFQDVGCDSCGRQRFNTMQGARCDYRGRKQQLNIIQHKQTS
jgi:hypothetical protein